jgi:hypothetical protein
MSSIHQHLAHILNASDRTRSRHTVIESSIQAIRSERRGSDAMLKRVSERLLALRGRANGHDSQVGSVVMDRTRMMRSIMDHMLFSKDARPTNAAMRTAIIDRSMSMASRYRQWASREKRPRDRALMEPLMSIHAAGSAHAEHLSGYTPCRWSVAEPMAREIAGLVMTVCTRIFHDHTINPAMVERLFDLVILAHLLTLSCPSPERASEYRATTLLHEVVRACTHDAWSPGDDVDRVRDRLRIFSDPVPGPYRHLLKTIAYAMIRMASHGIPWPWSASSYDLRDTRPVHRFSPDHAKRIRTAAYHGVMYDLQRKDGTWVAPWLLQASVRWTHGLTPLVTRWEAVTKFHPVIMTPTGYAERFLAMTPVIREFQQASGVAWLDLAHLLEIDDTPMQAWSVAIREAHGVDARHVSMLMPLFIDDAYEYVRAHAQARMVHREHDGYLLLTQSEPS